MFEVKWFEKFKMHHEEIEDYQAAVKRYDAVRKLPETQVAYVFQDGYLVRAVDEEWYPGIDGGFSEEPDEWPLRSMSGHAAYEDPGNAFVIEWLEGGQPPANDRVAKRGGIRPSRYPHWPGTTGYWMFAGLIDPTSLSQLLSHYNRLYELGVLLEVLRRQAHRARADEPLDLPVLAESLDMAVSELEQLLRISDFDDSERWKPGPAEQARQKQ